MGLGTVAESVSKGSKISKNPLRSISAISGNLVGHTKVPFSYVETNVAKLATFCRDACSSKRFSSSVRIKDWRRSAQNLMSLYQEE